jgi:F-type H+-transporting ATPase subunit a
MVRIFSILFTLLFSTQLVFGSTGPDDADGEGFAPGEIILHHVQDDHVWEFWHADFGTLYLPIILFSNRKGIEVFSSSNFYDENHNKVPYNGYILDDHGHVIPTEAGLSIYDISITKNVAELFLVVALLLFIFLSIAAKYKKNPMGVPSGMQSLFEPIIIFVRDDIAKMAIGPKYKKFLPYLLTIFFFIWIGNLVGLLPGAANLTGNIAVTLVLALCTFIVTNVSGNKEYWGHIFNTPGVPKPLLPILVPVEFLGLFTKPFALMVRLFVAITAGHIVILSLIMLTFIFQSYVIGVASTLLVAFINIIELLVATIQAYVFTLFSAMYIGAAVAEHHHDEHQTDEALI